MLPARSRRDGRRPPAGRGKRARSGHVGLAPAAAQAARPIHQDSAVNFSHRLAPIPRNFLGISLEYEPAMLWGGNDTVPNVPFIRLLRQFTDTGNGPPVLRVGGGSTDDSWWNPDVKPPPPPGGTSYGIRPAWIEAVRALVSRTGSPLILGLNFLQGDPQFAVDWAREAMKGFGRSRIMAFEIGNEPDIYTIRPFGTHKHARSRPYTFTRYLRELRPFITRLRAMRPRPPLAGPVACCFEEFQRGLPTLLRRFGSDLKLVTYHAYPLNNCQRPYPTISTLLRSTTTTTWPQNVFTPLVAVARQRRKKVRITESNSIACTGLAGVSNTFASALWGTDWLFESLAHGVAGVDITSYGSNYAPFDLTGEWHPPALPRPAVIVHPLYYGMLLFARATANRARLVAVDYDLHSVFPDLANVKVWATLDRRRTLRIVVLDKDLRHRAARVRVKVAGARRAGTLIRMTAPSIRSTSGVTLGGQKAGEPSTYSGELEGPVRSEKVRPRGRFYTVRFSGPGAALLTIPHAGR